MNAIECMKKFLHFEGFHFEEKESHILFKYQMTSFMFVKETNEKLFHLSIWFYDINASNRNRALEVANIINSEKAVIKVCIDDDSVWINYETFIEDNISNSSIEFALNIMKGSFDSFYNQMT